jgi:hypothetical protein
MAYKLATMAADKGIFTMNPYEQTYRQLRANGATAWAGKVISGPKTAGTDLSLAQLTSLPSSSRRADNQIGVWERAMAAQYLAEQSLLCGG